MLLIDGVKYELWTPPSEDELEQKVKEHAQDIFGEQSIYLDRKQKLKSLSGVGSIPDGYVITLGDVPQWHIVEVELSWHPLHDHIVSQVSRFINGIKNPSTQRDITQAIYNEITRDGFLKLKLEKTIQSAEIYKFLSDLISKTPVLTIVIEKETEGLREAIDTLAHPEIKVVEFQTFTREGVGFAVNAHIFEPLYEAATPKAISTKVTTGAKQNEVMTPRTPEDTLEVYIQKYYIDYRLIEFPPKRRSFFPGYTISFTLERDDGEFEAHVTSAPAGTQEGDPNKGKYITGKLADWYRRHQIKEGDKVVFKTIEPMKKYRLDIL